MKNDYQELLNSVFCDVLEKLTFMFAEVPDDPHSLESPSECVRTVVDFTGCSSGTLSLVVPRTLCSEFAANMLGIDEEDALVDEKAFDALKELVNVTCGHVLTDLVGEELVFDLSAPSVDKLDVQAWTEQLNMPTTLLLVVDDASPVLLELKLDT